MGRLGQGKPQRSKKHKRLKKVELSLSGDIDSLPQVKPGPSPKRKDLEDDDQLSANIKDFMRLKQLAKVKPIKRRRKNKFKDESHRKDWIEEAMYRPEKGMKKPVKEAPKFVQGKRESELSFYNRMERTTQEVIAKAQFEDKFKVKLGDDGSMIPMKKKKQNKKAKERLKQLKEKQNAMKEKKLSRKVDEFSDLKDEIKFGEVASAPPQISAKPRKSQDIIGKSGAKSLLLTSMLENTSQPKVPPSRQVGKTLKRKLMSPAQQLIMDSERQKAIDNYRQLKNRKTISYPGIE